MPWPARFLRPSSEGRFPVALRYDGYETGRQPIGGVTSTPLPQRLLEAGFAVVGANVPGTGCSGGPFNQAFRKSWATDGKALVEWLARRPWSTGRVGLHGSSFPGIMANFVAGERPEGLVAVAPSAWIGDLRDVIYPGGIFNISFPTAFQPAADAYAATGQAPASAGGDSECAANAAMHAAEFATDPGVKGAQAHPYVDAFWGESVLTPERSIAQIDVPVLASNNFQDGVVQGSALDYFGSYPAKTSWFVVGNGDHGTASNQAFFVDQEVKFFQHFVADERNDFEDTPKVQIVRELTTTGQFTIGASPRWPPPTQRRVLHLRKAGTLSRHLPSGPESADSYDYPLPAGSQTASSGPNPWRVPPPSGGNAAFTTPPLGGDLDLLGASSLDLWVTSTSPTPDFQITVSEVRPDGQEQYLQRGWLRASERKLSARSTATWPRPTYFQNDVQPLVPGQPTLLRVPIYPLEHVFRRGTRIRVSIEAPSGTTGLASFDFDRTQAVINVLHDHSHDSQFVFDTLDSPAATPSPACDTVLNEPCRSDPGRNPTAEASGPLDPSWVPAGSSNTNGPQPRSCTSRRTVTITIPRRRGRQITSIRVRVAGRTYVVRGDRRALAVSFRGLPKAEVSVRLNITSNKGARRVLVRRYRPCTRRR